MNALLNIHKKTMEDINGYLAVKDPPGVILQGIPGLGKGRAAVHIASKLLGCEPDKLHRNPDFYQAPCDGPLKAEDIQHVLDFCCRCSIGPKKAIIIPGAHTITPATQNNLLKVLEDRQAGNVLILTADNNSLLGTIKSRCFNIAFHPLSTPDMKKYLAGLGIEDQYQDVLCFLTENAPGQVTGLTPEIESYLALYRELRSLTLREDLFSLTHTMKEKDSEDFFSVHGRRAAWTIRLMLYPFYRMVTGKWNGRKPDHGYPYAQYSHEQAMKTLDYGLTHLAMLQGTYTKNDFFNLLRFIVQA